MWQGSEKTQNPREAGYEGKETKRVPTHSNTINYMISFSWCKTITAHPRSTSLLRFLPKQKQKVDFDLRAWKYGPTLTRTSKTLPQYVKPPPPPQCASAGASIQSLRPELDLMEWGLRVEASVWHQTNPNPNKWNGTNLRSLSQHLAPTCDYFWKLIGWNSLRHPC